jgi:hypothetical protein
MRCLTVKALLKSNGQKQLRGIEISGLKEIDLDIIKEIVNDAICLDETKPYESKRKQKSNK